MSLSHPVALKSVIFSYLQASSRSLIYYYFFFAVMKNVEAMCSAVLGHKYTITRFVLVFVDLGHKSTS